MAGALRAFRRTAIHALKKGPYKQGSASPPPESLITVYEAARVTDPLRITNAAARTFFETYFDAYRVEPGEGAEGKVTAYYEPTVEARREKAGDFVHPFLRRPPELVKVADPDTPPEGVPKGFAFALQTGEGLVESPDRQAVDQGAFAGRDLEIAWARDKADVFFTQVQGSARLDFGDGSGMRIGYAAKSGHPFTGIGRILVERGEIPQAEISMQTIRKWLADHPDEADALMWENRSYIFFREIEIPDDAPGPIGAADVPLEPGRSLAVDRLIHSFGTPIFVSAPNLRDFDAPKPFRRLMIAQDTGSAIVGPARGDLYAGGGDRAGELAGGVNAVASFTLLFPRA
ncbi:transglycosylase [Pseudohoeflea suaedae]|uniref:peptidoglycan lytic exotransglycosylase n=1 Tax=Pseudohoeflea suaedae TaxID=877384 RepID=A0A4R5PQF8_9HYPH|nr:transglycosylase [Pseudohoeflea suaedae]